MTRALRLLIGGVAGFIFAGCQDRQAETLDTRDFSAPCSASCSRAFECADEPFGPGQTYESCVEECNDPTLTQWIPECEELAVAAWFCSGDMTCEQLESSSENPSESACAAENAAFITCLSSNTP